MVERHLEMEVESHPNQAGLACLGPAVEAQELREVLLPGLVPDRIPGNSYRMLLQESKIGGRSVIRKESQLLKFVSRRSRSSTRLPNTES